MAAVIISARRLSSSGQHFLRNATRFESQQLFAARGVVRLVRVPAGRPPRRLCSTVAQPVVADEVASRSGAEPAKEDVATKQERLHWEKAREHLEAAFSSSEVLSWLSTLSGGYQGMPHPSSAMPREVAVVLEKRATVALLEECASASERLQAGELLGADAVLPMVALLERLRADLPLLPIPPFAKDAVLELVLGMPLSSRAVVLAGHMPFVMRAIGTYRRGREDGGAAAMRAHLAPALATTVNIYTRTGSAVTPPRVMALFASLHDRAVTDLKLAAALRSLLVCLPVQHFPTDFLLRVLQLYPPRRSVPYSWALRQWVLPLFQLGNPSTIPPAVYSALHSLPYEAKIAIHEEIRNTCIYLAAKGIRLWGTPAAPTELAYLNLIELLPDHGFNGDLERTLYGIVLQLPTRKDIRALGGLSWRSLIRFVHAHHLQHGSDSIVCALLYMRLPLAPTLSDQYMLLSAALSACPRLLRALAEPVARAEQGSGSGDEPKYSVKWVHDAACNAAMGHAARKRFAELLEAQGKKRGDFASVLDGTSAADLTKLLGVLPAGAYSRCRARMRQHRAKLELVEAGTALDQALAQNAVTPAMMVSESVLLLHPLTADCGVPRLVRFYQWLASMYSETDSVLQDTAVAFLKAACHHLSDVSVVDYYVSAFQIQSPPELHWFCDGLREEALRRMTAGQLDVCVALPFATFQPNHRDGVKTRSFLRSFSAAMRQAVDAAAATAHDRLALLQAIDYRDLVRVWSAVKRFNVKHIQLWETELLLPCIPTMSEEVLCLVMSTLVADMASGVALEHDSSHLCSALLDACLEHLVLCQISHCAPNDNLLRQAAIFLVERPIDVPSVRDVLAKMPINLDNATAQASVYGMLNLALPESLKPIRGANAFQLLYMSSSSCHLPAWWCVAKDALLAGDCSTAELLRPILHDWEVKRRLMLNLYANPTKKQRLFALQLHLMVEQLLGMSLLNGTFLTRRIIGNDLFADMEMSTLDVRLMLSSVFAGNCGALFEVDALGGFPVAAAYFVNAAGECAPLLAPLSGTSAREVLESFSETPYYRRIDEPAWPVDTVRKIVVVAATELNTIGPHYTSMAGVLSVWARLLENKGYEPKVISPKLLESQHWTATGLTAALLDDSRYLHQTQDSGPT